MSDHEMMIPGGGEPDQHGLGRSGGESMGAAADAAKAAALVKARYLMAWQRPRDHEDVRRRLLDACKRRSFAKASRYSIQNRGAGWTIRFAEEAFRCMGNLSVDTMVTYEDDDVRRLRIEVADLETNAPWADEILISKTVERRKVSSDREVVATRTTSTGQTVYVVRATDDEVMVKQLSQVSRRVRSLVLRFIDGGVLEECHAQVMRTQREEVENDPKAAIRNVLDGFAMLNVMPSDVAEYLGKPADKMTPAEVVDLRGVWQAVNEGADFRAMTREAVAGRGGKAKDDDEAEPVAQTQEEAVLADVPASADDVPPDDDTEPDESDAKKPRKPKGWHQAKRERLPRALTGAREELSIETFARNHANLVVMDGWTADDVAKAMPTQPMLALRLHRAIDKYLSDTEVQTALAAVIASNASADNEEK